MRRIPMKIIALATAASLMAGTAFAGGMSAPVVSPEPMTPMPAPIAVSDWSGFYVGAQYGTGGLDFDLGPDLDTTGYGLHAGYLWDLGQFVVGAELDYNRLSVDTAPEDIDM